MNDATNAAPKTIRSNATKMIASIFAKAEGCEGFSLSGGFVGADCAPSEARRAYDSQRASGCKPRFTWEPKHRRGPRYVVRIHPSLWFELRGPAPSAL